MSVWAELESLRAAILAKLGEVPSGSRRRVTVDPGVIPQKPPLHPIEIFAFTSAGSSPDPDVSTPLLALKHAFRDDEDIDIFEDVHGETITVQRRSQ